MSKLAVGKEVISYCGKCKLSLGHIIVAMKDTNTPAKVECLTCKSTHAYKDPGAASLKKAKTKKAPTSRRSIPVGQLWTEEMAKIKGRAVPYTIKAKFSKGDLIDHKTFGPGIVQELVDDKIEVLFQSDIKLLVHGK